MRFERNMEIYNRNNIISRARIIKVFGFLRPNVLIKIKKELFF